MQEELQRLMEASKLEMEAHGDMISEMQDIAQLHKSTQLVRKHHLQLFLIYFDRLCVSC